MKCYFIVSAFAVLVLTISFACGKQHGRRQKQRLLNNKHVYLLDVTHSRHQRHGKEPGKVRHNTQLKLRDRQALPGFKCRRVKFVVNRNLRLKKEKMDAMWRQIRKKHSKKVLHIHKFIRPNKKFQLPRETKLSEDKDGNFVTYIEDCVPSEQADKKMSFASEKELIMAPAFDERKVQQDRESPANTGLVSVKTEDRDEDGIGDEGILPAAEDSLFQTVSDSSEILKENAQKEASQFLNDQQDKEVPSNFAMLFKPAAMDDPYPKKTEQGREMTRYFSSNGFPFIPPIPDSDVVTPGNNQVPGQDNDFNPASDTGYVTSPVSQGKAFTQEIPPHTIENAEEDGFAHSFSEAFSKLGNAEENELESYATNGLRVPQTLGEEMKVENEEVDYEKTLEKEYGKSNSIARRKG